MIEVLFLVLAESLLLDLAGPAEAFRLANQYLRRRGRPEAFRLRFIGPRPQVTSSIGLALAGIEPLPDVLPPRCWVVLLGRPGDVSRVLRHDRDWLRARQWLSKHVAPGLAPQAAARPAGQELKLVTICVGAVLAAEAGLVGTREVTTHHEVLDELARAAPQATVVANRVFIEDGPLASSAGISAGIDLALHLIARTCGAAVAGGVAQVMVAFARRSALDPQRSPLLAWRDHLHPAIHRVQDAVCADPAADWGAARLAAVACVTERHLGRLFRLHVGISPREYVEHVRSTVARYALERGASSSAAAELAGFGSPRRLRRSFARVP